MKEIKEKKHRQGKKENWDSGLMVVVVEWGMEEREWREDCVRKERKKSSV
jgi:hypothetical protein